MVDILYEMVLTEVFIVGFVVGLLSGIVLTGIVVAIEERKRDARGMDNRGSDNGQ